MLFVYCVLLVVWGLLFAGCGSADCWLLTVVCCMLYVVCCVCCLLLCVVC